MSEQEALVARCFRCRRIAPVVMFSDGTIHICCECGNLSSVRRPEWVPVRSLGTHYMTHAHQYITRDSPGVFLAAEAARPVPTIITCIETSSVIEPKEEG